MGVELERAAELVEPDTQSTGDLEASERPTYLRLAARKGSKKVSTIGIQPPLKDEQIKALVGALELYDVHKFIGDSLIPVRPAEGDPYTELDIERLERRAGEDGLELRPKNLARFMRDILGHLGPVYLDKEVMELGPKDYMFGPDLPLPEVELPV